MEAGVCCSAAYVYCRGGLVLTTVGKWKSTCRTLEASGTNRFRAYDVENVKLKKLPAYPPFSASFINLCGMGGVRAAA